MTKQKLSVSGKALALLARREHSERELKFKLLQKGYSEDEVESAIAQMIKANYLSNDRFIGCVIRARIEQGAGPNKIKAELKSHDITSIQIKSHEDWQKANWRLSAIRVKQKRFGVEPATDNKQKAKQLQFLLRRGFNQEDAQAAISNTDELSFFHEPR